MNEPISKEESFRRVPLMLDGFSSELFVNTLGVEVLIIRERNEGDIRLYVREARAIRDYLNKVLA